MAKAIDSSPVRARGHVTAVPAGTDFLLRVREGGEKVDILYSPHLSATAVPPQVPVEPPDIAIPGVRVSAERIEMTGLKEIQAAIDRLLEDPDVYQPLLERGWISLEQEHVAALGYQAVGGFIIADSAQVTNAANAVIADEDLFHPLAAQVFPWLKAGRDASEVIGNAKQMNARFGDLLVLEAGLEATAEQVKQLLIENGIEGAQAARAVLGNRGQVSALPVFAFQLFASRDGLPPVIVLGVMVRLQGEAGDAYTLVLMV